MGGGVGSHRCLSVVPSLPLSDDYVDDSEMLGQYGGHSLKMPFDKLYASFANNLHTEQVGATHHLHHHHQQEARSAPAAGGSQYAADACVCGIRARCCSTR